MKSAPEQGTVVAFCPKCGKKYRVDKRIIGKTVKCKACDSLWQVQPGSTNGSGSVDASQLVRADSSSMLLGQSTAAGNQSSLNLSLEDIEGWAGQRLGRFQITKVIGRGAMGVVFLAHDPDLKRDVALKILAKQLTSDKRTFRLEQFIREARSAARLTHAHSVTVYEIGHDRGWYFIAMELVEGGTLLDLVRKKKRRVPIERICELIAQAADALSAAHKLGIIHRDIKPSNLMLTKDGKVKVADFGLAQLAEADDDFELPTKAVGTPYWMSPEQAQGKDAIPQSDMYSLGAVLYFSLVGEVPFKGQKKRELLQHHLETPVPDPRLLRKDVPETIYKIIRRAMAKNPQERYQDAAEMGIGLRQLGNKLHQSQIAERWYGNLASAGMGGSPTTPQAQNKSSKWTVLILVIMLAALIGGLVLWAMSGKETPPPTPQRQVAPPRTVAPVEKDVAPAPKEPVKAVADVPVYVIKGTRTYHARNCPKLKNVPASNLTEITSRATAENQGLLECRYCKKMLQTQIDKAAKTPITHNHPLTYLPHRLHWCIVAT